VKKTRIQTEIVKYLFKYIIQRVYVGSTNYEGYDFVITMFKTVYIYTLSEINFRKIWNRSLSASCMLEFFN
jgi:hypothetical protein